MFTSFDKALMPLVILVVFGVLTYFKVVPVNITSQVVTLVVSALGVYLTPNKA